MLRNILSTSHNGRFNYELITPKTLESALNILKKSFFKDEPLCKITGVCNNSNSINELIKLPEYISKHGLSFVAIDNLSGKVAGTMFNKLLVSNAIEESNFYQNSLENCKELPTKATYKFLMEADAIFDIFDYYKVDTAIELGLAGVEHEYRKKGLCQKFTEIAIEFTANLAKEEYIKLPNKTKLYPAPKVITALPTGPYSRKIARKLGFEKLAEISFYEYFKGKTFDGKDIDPNSIATLEGFKIK